VQAAGSHGGRFPDNLRLLTAVLKRGGLEPGRPPAASWPSRWRGRAADLVVLDIRMPEMSGLEVCRWFKQNERLRAFPLSSSVAATTRSRASALAGGLRFQAVSGGGGACTHQDPSAPPTPACGAGVAQPATRAAGCRAGQDGHRVHLSTIFALAKLAEVRDDDTGSTSSGCKPSPGC